MSSDKKLSIVDFKPTVFLAGSEGSLRQLVQVTVESSGTAATVVLSVAVAGKTVESPPCEAPPGESTHEVYVDEITAKTTAEVVLKCEDTVTDRKTFSCDPPRHWTVHVVQYSHHDVGYTDLPSAVLRQSDGYLDATIDMAEETSGFPDDAQFRISCEQTWSMDHFLRTAPPERAAKMIELMRSGHVELTALFGNMTTEICGHESLTRAVYHAFRLKREHGIPLLAASHVDVPGLSWGLCSVLAQSGIKMLYAGLPYYWFGEWRNERDLQSYWDDDTMFGGLLPGAFWWESQSGKRVLFWHAGLGAFEYRAELPDLAPYLERITGLGYPYDTLRFRVVGFRDDNSYYIVDYAHAIRRWNEKWAYPRLVCGTNTTFYDDLITKVPEDLPTYRAELPGQDFPVGAMSTADVTAMNRNSHSDLLTAEKLATAAELVAGCPSQDQQIALAYEDVLWHEEHTWGFHRPHGPEADAARAEKVVHAPRAASLGRVAMVTAMGSIADRVRVEEGDDPHLVVFNSLSRPRTGVVSAPLIADRGGTTVPPEIVEGRFDLVDLDTGRTAPFQLADIVAADDTLPHAAERLAMDYGAKKVGDLDVPSGLRRDVRFIAEDVPGCGYKTYRLAPRGGKSAFEDSLSAADSSIENEYYRVEADRESGGLSIFDKEAGCELVDASAPHRFGDVIVRTPFSDAESTLEEVAVGEALGGPVGASISRTGSVHGHPRVMQTVTLHRGLKRIEFACRILKDPTPLLDVHLAFPFAVEDPQFRYEGNLSFVNPIEDYFPGAYSDAIAVQNWVKVGNGRFSVLWSSLDAPVAGLGGLWPGYMSPVHCCIVPKRMPHPPLKVEDLKKGWMYSTIFYNNVRTNFYPSQAGDFLFRYAISSFAGEVSDSEAAAFGWDAVTPLQQTFAQRQEEASLPVKDTLIRIDNSDVVLLTCKRAENGNGLVLRLWNTASTPNEARVGISGFEIARACVTTLAEEDTEEAVGTDGADLTATFQPNDVVTVRVIGQPICAESP